MAMKTGFGRVNLKTSTFAAGGISFMMVFMMFAARSMIFWTTYFDSGPKIEGSVYEEQRRVIAKSYYLSCATAAILLCALVCLLYGTYKGIRAFLIPYLVAFGILVPGNALIIIHVLIYEPEFWVTALLPMIFIPLTIYCLCIVGSYYIKLNPNNRQEFQIQATTFS